jgi:uncharacterized protein involved in outer membrane biogenesis
MKGNQAATRKRNLIKWTALVLGGVLLTGIILLFSLDLGFLRSSLENRVSQATGRDFSIAGPLSIRLGRDVVFSAADVSLGNPAWAGEEPLARIASVQGRIELRSLFSSTARLRSLGVSGLDLQLIQQPDGRANWEFEAPGAPDDSGMSLLVEQLEVADSLIVLSSPRLDRPLRLEVSSLQQALTAEGHLSAILAARLNDQPVRFQGKAGPYAQFFAGDNIQIEGSGALGGTEIAGSALLDKLWSPERPRFELTISGPELAELADMLGIEGLGSGPLDLKASSTPLEQGLQVEVNGQLGPLRIELTGTAPSLADLSNARLDAALAGPNFGRIARLAGLDGWPETAFELDAALRRPGTGLEIERMHISMAGAQLSVSGQVPAFPALAGASLKLAAEGQDIAPFETALGLADMPRGAFRIAGDVTSGSDDSALLALDYAFPVARGRIAGTLGGGEDLLGTDLDIEGRGDNAHTFGNSLGFPGLPSAPWTLGLNLAISEPGYYRLADLAFAAGGLDARLSGRLDAARPQERFELDFTVSGPRLSALQGMVGDAPGLPELPFRATGRVNADRDRWRLEQVEGVAGDTTFKVNGILGLGEAYTGTELAINANGKNLGQLASLPEPAKLPDGPYELATRLTLAPGALALQGFTLTAGALSINADADLPWPLDASTGRFTLQARGQDISRILPVWAGMTVRRNAFEADFKGAWTERVLTLDRATARVGEARVGGEGTLALPPSPDATRLTLEANVPNPGQLLEADGKSWASLPLALQASFEGAAKNLRTSALSAQLGANTVTGRLDLDLESERPRFDTALQAGTLDLRPFQPEAAANAAAPPSARVIPDLAYPMEALASVSGSFEFTAERLLLRQGAFRDVRLEGALRDGVLAISEMGMGGFKGRLTASLDLALAGGLARLTTRIQAQDFVLDRDRLTAEQKAASPAFTADVQLEGRGTGLRETAAAFSGSISLQSNGGRYYRTQKEGSRPQLLPAIIAAIKPELARQDAVSLACVAGSASVANGRINLQPGFFAYTDKLRVVASGSANLANEQLDISVETRERQAGGAVSESFAPALKVSGTLAAHTISLDRKATLLSGSASFLKGSLADLAKLALDQGGGSRDPCTDILRQREQQTPP